MTRPRSPRPASSLVLLASLVALTLACADAHWDAVTWPAKGEGIPAQPRAASAAAGVELTAAAMEWEPEAVVVELELRNTGAGNLSVERRAIMLAYGELEYAVAPPERDAPEPAVVELGPEASARLRLRYQLGRPLVGPGAQLILRSCRRDGVAIVELPALALPPQPAR